MTISISELEAACAAMTPGEWRHVCSGEANTNGIVAMRNALPDLLAIVKAALEWQMSPQEPAREARKRLLTALARVTP